MNGTEEITSGVTLSWALVSLSVGMTIVAIVLLRLWLDYRDRRADRSESNSAHTREADKIAESDAMDQDSFEEQPN